MQDNKKLTVAYGSFACVVEGFDDPFPLMQETVAYFESLSRLNPEFAHQAELADFETLRERFAAEGTEISLVAIPGGIAIRNVTREVEAVAVAVEAPEPEAVDEVAGQPEPAPPAPAPARTAEQEEDDIFSALTADLDDTLANVGDNVGGEAALRALREAMSRMSSMGDGSGNEIFASHSEEDYVALDDLPADGDQASEAEAAQTEAPEVAEAGQDGATGDGTDAEDDTAADRAPEGDNAPQATAEPTPQDASAEDAPAEAAPPEAGDAPEPEDIVAEAPAEEPAPDDAAEPAVEDDHDAQEPTPEPEPVAASARDMQPAREEHAETDAAEPALQAVADEADAPDQDPAGVAASAEPAAPAAPLILGDAPEDDGAPQAADPVEGDADTLVFTKTPAPQPPADAPRLSDRAPAQLLRLGPSDLETAHQQVASDRQSFIDARNSNKDSHRDTPYGTGHTPLVLGTRQESDPEDVPKRGFLKILKGGGSPGTADGPQEPPEMLEFSDGGEEHEDAPKSGFGLGRLKVPGLGWGRKSGEAEGRAADPRDDAPAAEAADKSGRAEDDSRRAPLRVVTSNPEPEPVREEKPAAAAAPEPAPAPKAEPAPPPDDGKAGDLSDRLHASFSGTEPKASDDGFAIDETDLEGEEERSARRFAFQVGADSLPELMKACATYLVYAEGKNTFTRGELLSLVQSTAGANQFSAEARIRTFGKLIRGGDLAKTEGGHFALSPKVVEAFREHLHEIAV